MHTNKARLPGGSLYEKAKEQLKEKAAAVISGRMIRKYGTSDAMEVTPENLKKASLIYTDLLKKTRFDKSGYAKTRFISDLINNMLTESKKYASGEMAIPGASKNPDDIFNFYWQCQEFKDFWVAAGFTDVNLKNILANQTL